MRNSSAKGAQAAKITDIPEAIFLNGMTLIPKSSNILVADSGAGVVYAIDTSTGKYSVAVHDPLMKPVNGSQLGVNGIKIRDGSLYFTSTTQAVFAKVPISANGTASAAAKVISHVVGDDFIFNSAGNALVATNIGNSLDLVTTSGAWTGNTSVVVGNVNSTTLAGSTAAEFGRTQHDRGVLYVTTTGGLASPVNGTYTEGGKVVAITGLA